MDLFKLWRLIIEYIFIYHFMSIHYINYLELPYKPNILKQIKYVHT